MRRYLIIFAVIFSLLLIPSFGVAEEIFSGNGAFDSIEQINDWNLVNKTGVSTWSLDTEKFFSGTGSGRLDSPVGNNVDVDSYVYHSFSLPKKPVEASLNLAYKKEYLGTQPSDGNWDIGVEVWREGDSTPLQTLSIDTTNTNSDFKPLTNQKVDSIKEANTKYELRIFQKGKTGNSDDSKLSLWLDDVSLNITYDTTPPKVSKIIPTDENTIQVVFDDQLDKATAENLNHYSIDQGLQIVNATLQADQKTVVLTTSTQEFMTVYHVTTTGVQDQSGNIMQGSQTNNFIGVDKTPPQVLDVSPVKNDVIDVNFNENIDSVTANLVYNYNIFKVSTQAKLGIKSANLQPNGLTVRIQTAPEEGGVQYSVYANGVQDLAGNSSVAQIGSTFTAQSPPTLEGPKLLSATAIDNSTIALKFSSTIDIVSAQNTDNYVIDPSLSVTGAQLQKDGQMVRLTTNEQKEGTLYKISASNISDIYGNTISLDNSTAVFTGNSKMMNNPHDKYLTDTNRCAQCHVMHVSTNNQLLKTSEQTELCYLCHDAGGQSKYDVADEFGKDSSDMTSHHQIPEGKQECSDCHNPHGGAINPDGTLEYRPRLLQSKEEPNAKGGNEFCFSCHKVTVGNSAPLQPEDYPTDGVGHNNSSFVINGVTPFNPQSGTDIRCLGCHEDHGSKVKSLINDNPTNTDNQLNDSGNSLCYKCHQSASSDNRYIGQSAFDNKTLNPHVRTTSINTTTVFPGLKDTAGLCDNCHDPHGTKYGTSKVKMKTLRDQYNDNKDLYTADDFRFCFRCHNNSSANIKYDIETQYKDSNGGHVIKSAGGQLQVGSKMPCETCHTLHGTENNNKYMLKKELGSNLGDGRNECLACHQDGKVVLGINLSSPNATVNGHQDSSKECLSCHASTHALK